MYSMEFSFLFIIIWVVMIDTHLLSFWLAMFLLLQLGKQENISLNDNDHDRTPHRLY